MAKATRKMIQSFCPENLLPFDKFRLDFDENWSESVSLASFEGKKMMAGIPRIMQRSKDSDRMSKQPHVDFLPLKYGHLEGQFTVNIYLRTADNGGNLELWDVPPLTSVEAQALDINFDWRSELNKPIVIKPIAGDLLMFNSRCPHAVTAFSIGQRLSIQSFVGLKGNKQIVLWS